MFVHLIGSRNLAHLITKPAEFSDEFVAWDLVGW